MGRNQTAHGPPPKQSSYDNPASPRTTRHLTRPATRRRNTDRHVLAVNPQEAPPHPPPPGAKPNPSPNHDVEAHRPAGSIPIDGADRPAVHVGVGGRERGVQSRQILLPLNERRDPSLGQGIRLVVNVGEQLVVDEPHLLVGVVDREPDGPRAGDGGRGGGDVEAGEREGVDPELGDARAEDEPDDEEDGAEEDEEGDHGGEEAAEEGGAGGRGGVVGVGVGVVRATGVVVRGLGLLYLEWVAVRVVGMLGVRRSWVPSDRSRRVSHGGKLTTTRRRRKILGGDDEVSTEF